MLLYYTLSQKPFAKTKGCLYTNGGLKFALNTRMDGAAMNNKDKRDRKNWGITQQTAGFDDDLHIS